MQVADGQQRRKKTATFPDELIAPFPVLPIADTSKPETAPEAENRFSASKSVIEITELLVMILAQVDTKTLLLSQRVSYRWRAVISQTKELQQKLFMRPASVQETASLGMMTRPHDAGRQPPGHALNPLFFQRHPGDPLTCASLRLGFVADIAKPEVTRLDVSLNTDGFRPGSWQCMSICMPPLQRLPLDMYMAPNVLAVVGSLAEAQSNETGSIDEAAQWLHVHCEDGESQRLGQMVKDLDEAAARNARATWWQGANIEVSWL